MPAKALHVVPASQPEDVTDETMQARIRRHRSVLFNAAVRYVKEGREMTWHDRLRQASNLSGIPITFIEIEAKK